MLPPERRRVMLGAPPPRRRAGAVRRTASAGAGDAVEAAVRRAASRRRISPQAREPRLDTREAVSRIVASTKEPDLRHTQEPREGGGMRLGMPRREVVGQEEGPTAVEAFDSLLQTGDRFGIKRLLAVQRVDAAPVEMQPGT